MRNLFVFHSNFLSYKHYLVLFLSINFSNINASILKNNPADTLSTKQLGILLINDLLNRKDFQMYHVGECISVHYAEACAAFGAIRLAALLNDSSMIIKLKNRYKKVIDDNIPNTANHVDANVYGILPLELFLHTNDSIFFNQGITLANKQWENPLSDGMSNQTRFWIDDIYMISSLQVQAFRATGNYIYLQRCAYEIYNYITKLQQPNGLFHHGANAPFFWGRGNGWVAAGLIELLYVLPDTNFYYPIIKESFVKMIDIDKLEPYFIKYHNKGF